jgi:DNA polymerase
MRTLNIDIETYSSVDIKKAGAYKYAQSPDFEILLFAYSWDSGLVEIVDLACGESLPMEVIHALYDPQVIKHAYNAAFEWYCINRFMQSPIEQWRCTQVHGLYCGYVAGLGQLGEIIGIPQDKRKMGTGGALIRTFCIPQKPTKTNGQRTRTLPHHEPEKWQLFKQYCIGDVAAEMEIQRRLSAFPVLDQEWQLWHIDQRINARGVACDMVMVEGALAVDEQVTGELRAEAIALTGIDNPKSVQQLSKWLEEETGEEVDNLRKDTVSKLIVGMDEGKAKRVLEIRQELSKTSTKKYVAMQIAACADGRVRGLVQFYGANRTGRWAGRIVQIQNLPRNYLSTLEYARQLVVERRIDMLKFVYGNVPDTLSQLIRTAFTAATGKQLTIADYSAIEARVIAWLAGEQWRLDVFATHGKIYEASASQMFGVPLEQIGKGSDLRQKGKVAELALGYQGGKGALIAMGALDQGLTEDELPEIVTRWRNANRRIVDLWYSIEAAAIEVMETGQPVGVKGLIFARESHHATQQDFFTIQLPSGRKLYYAKPFLKLNDFNKPALHYWGMDQQTKKWTVLNTYGGKLVENVVQAIARDCLAVTLVSLEQAGYETVLHVHDEVGIETDNPDELERVLEIMGRPVPWAPGLPLKGAGFVTDFYMKD